MTRRKILLSETLRERARLFALAGDETRIRVLCFLFEQREACVTDIAAAVGMPLNTVSHHLRVMRDNGMLESERIGTTICYKVVPSAFMNNLMKAIRL